jgi:hypothetical protein
MDLTLAPAELMGTLPRVCIKSGLPATKLRPATFKYIPVASYALLALIFVGIYARSHRRISVKLPVNPAAITAQWKRLGIAVLVLLGGTGVLGGLAYVTHVAALAVPALVCFIVGLLMMTREQNFMQGRLTKDGLLVLKDVSPAFVVAWNALAAERHEEASQRHADVAAKLRQGA